MTIQYFINQYKANSDIEYRKKILTQEVEIKDTNQLNDIMKELRKVESVFNVERKK